MIYCEKQILYLTIRIMRNKVQIAISPGVIVINKGKAF